ncbi:mobB [Klebsiella pneumoniae]|uniref:MobB n=1 Tax=Klebsiella pneumoniae TaxID=573 RepID=A0A2X3IIH9_KLEPN|nr:mobB [Klebsiella pneumoniae]
MFNTDSLAWKWHIPELARQIYPWVQLAVPGVL